MLARAAAILLLIALPAAAEGWYAIDGDTIALNGEKVRVLGVDTPELSGWRCASELQAAQAAREFTQAALDRGPVRLERARLDKYGRTLARVMIGDRDLAELLIAAGHGRPYNGERRRPWC